MVRRLRELGMPIDAALEDLPTTDDDALGRPSIARAMIAAGFATSVEDAFVRHLSRGRPAYVPRMGLDAVDSIRAIRAAGGLASLAHFAEAPTHLPFIRELIAAGLNGIEVYYRSYEPPAVERLRKVALELRLTTPAARTTTATARRTPRRTRSCGSRRPRKRSSEPR